jgi:VWFA-related protein
MTVSPVRNTLTFLLIPLLLFTLVLAPVEIAKAQSSSSQSTLQTTSPTAGQKPGTPDQTVPAAGGPQGDTGPIAVPKKKEKEEKPPERKPRLKNPEGMGDYSLTVNVPLVNVDVGVLTKDGQFIPGLKKENFKVYEDGVPQPITGFNQSEAPITAVLLVEFASTTYGFIYDMLNAAYTFTNSLKKEDYIAVVAYDMKPEIVVDFTQDKRQVFAGLNSLRIPGFRETNLFDALFDTIDRVENIEGRKYIVLISTGCDSFSKLTYNKILDKVKNTKETTIYAVGTGQALRIWAESRNLTRALPCTGSNFEEGAVRLDFLQADNQMKTFASLTGGKAYFPRFEGEMPGIFSDIAQTIRNQYTIAYHPTNSKQDGTYRKLKIELVDDKGGPLRVVNEKGKPIKYQIVARAGYKAKQVVE